MKVKLIPENIFKNIPSEEELVDMSILESIYIIRKLKACIVSEKNGFIEVSQPCIDGNYEDDIKNQIFSPVFNTGFLPNEYEKLED